MRKAGIFLLSLVLLVTSSVLNAQNNPPQTLLGDGPMLQTDKMGFFLAPSLGLTAIDGSTAALINVRGGLSFNDKISFGAFYSSSINQIKPVSETLDGIYLDYWSAGALLEYTFFSERLLHLSMPLFLGYGELEMDNELGDLDLGEQGFFQIEPAVLLELNLHKYARLNIGAGYRFISDVNYRNLNQNNVNGVTAYLGLKFGWFS